jgi:hypothetical protein
LGPDATAQTVKAPDPVKAALVEELIVALKTDEREVSREALSAVSTFRDFPSVSRGTLRCEKNQRYPNRVGQKQVKKLYQQRSLQQDTRGSDGELGGE